MTEEIKATISVKEIRFVFEAGTTRFYLLVDVDGALEWRERIADGDDSIEMFNEINDPEMLAEVMGMPVISTLGIDELPKEVPGWLDTFIGAFYQQLSAHTGFSVEVLKGRG